MMMVHNVLSGRATGPDPGLRHNQPLIPAAIVAVSQQVDGRDITDEEMIEALSRQTDRTVERLIAANTAAKLGQPAHPAGFCDGEHCADALRQHEAAQHQRDVQIQQDTAKWIHQQYDHAARDLGRIDEWHELQREYVELANGIDHGPGFYIGTDRIVGGEEHPYITFTDKENGDVYHSPA